VLAVDEVLVEDAVLRVDAVELLVVLEEVVEEVVVGQFSVPLKMVKLSQFPSVAGLVLPCRFAIAIETGVPVPADHV